MLWVVCLFLVMVRFVDSVKLNSGVWWLEWLVNECALWDTSNKGGGLLVINDIQYKRSVQIIIFIRTFSAKDVGDDNLPHASAYGCVCCC